jgi:hypothetical protein
MTMCAKEGERMKRAGFPFGTMQGATAFPFVAAQGIAPGVWAGLGFSGWAIAFLVLFIIGIVFWWVWRSVGPVVSPLWGAGGLFW